MLAAIFIFIAFVAGIEFGYKVAQHEGATFYIKFRNFMSKADL